MEEAIAFLEKRKVFIDTLHMEMVPLSDAYKAIQIATNEQLTMALESISSTIGSLSLDLDQLTQDLDKQDD